MVPFLRKITALALFGFSLSLLPVLAQQPASMAVAQEMPKYYRNLPWVQGTKDAKSVRLCDVMDLKLPQGFVVLHKTGTQQLNRLTENPQTNECATIASGSMTWFAMLEYDRIGYVADTDKVDADKLMDAIKKGLAAGNRERARSGWAPLEMIGWIQEPTYDPALNQLVWSTKLVSDGDESINYETRILGREGVIEVILVSAPEDMETAVREFNMLLKRLTFIPGKRYSDVKPGDKRSKLSLSDLILGN